MKNKKILIALFLFIAIAEIKAQLVNDDAYHYINLLMKTRDLLEIKIRKDSTTNSTVIVSYKNTSSDTLTFFSNFLVDTYDGGSVYRGHINVYSCDSIPILTGDTTFYMHYKNCISFIQPKDLYEIGPPIFEIKKNVRVVKIPPKVILEFPFWYPFIREKYTFLRIQGYIIERDGKPIPYVNNTNILYFPIIFSFIERRVKDEINNIKSDDVVLTNVINTLKGHADYKENQYYMIIMPEKDDFGGFTGPSLAENWFIVQRTYDGRHAPHELGHCNGLDEFAVNIGVVPAANRNSSESEDIQYRSTNVMGYSSIYYSPVLPLKDFFS